MRCLSFKFFGMLYLAVLMMGCGEETTTSVASGCEGDACTTDENDAETLEDALSEEDTESALEDASLGETDTTEVDTTGFGDAETDASELDTQSDEDTNTETDGDDTPDLEGPVVVSIAPENEEEGVQIPFTVTITFDEPIREETVDGNTFVLRNPDGDSIGGKPTLSEDGQIVTLTPVETKQNWATPYEVEISFLVQDKLGNAMDGDFQSRFYTDAPPEMEVYEELAAQYAPLVYQSVRTGNTHYDVSTRVDLDEDWVASNNQQAIKSAAEVSPALYWDASETRSHVFLHYTLYYPVMSAIGEIAEPVSGDTAGVVVTLFKDPVTDEIEPVSVATYGTYSGVEELRVFQVSGSALGDANLVDGTDSWENLATDDAFQLWVTQPLHVACSWAVSGDGKCELNEGILLELNWLILSYSDGVPGLIIKDGGWPTSAEEFGLELLHGLTHLWPRRTLFGEAGLWRDNYSFDYSPLENRPGDHLTNLPSFFDPADDHDPGRPPWAWRWKPGLAQFTDLPQGTLYLDPAFFFMKRHGIAGYPWVASEGTGWSLEYCFHGALGIDERENFGECL